MEGCGWHLGQGCHQFLFSLPTGRKATRQGSLISGSNDFLSFFLLQVHLEGYGPSPRPPSQRVGWHRYPGKTTPQRSNSCGFQVWNPFCFASGPLEVLRPKYPGQIAKGWGVRTPRASKAPILNWRDRHDRTAFGCVAVQTVA